MNINHKTKIIFSLIIVSIFLFQSCAAIIYRTYQEIPVTSSPSGAKLIVDGEEMGYLPMVIKLKKKRNHTIRIEKQGYHPYEIKTTRKTRSGLSIFGGIAGGVVGLLTVYTIMLVASGADGENSINSPTLGWSLLIGGTALGAFLPMKIDTISGEKYKFYPKTLDVTLSRIEDKSKSNFLKMDAEQFQNIKWIRIKCTDSKEKD